MLRYTSMESYQCQNSVFELGMQKSNPQCRKSICESRNVNSGSENSIEKCRIHFRSPELQLTMRIDHVVRQFIKSNVEGRKSKPEFGTLMHCVA